MKLMRLSELKTGEKAVVVNVRGRGAFRKRIIEMGFIQGKVVTVLQNAPLKDPILYRIMGYEVSLRRNDAQLIKVLGPVETDNEIVQATNQEKKGPEATVSDTTREYMKDMLDQRSKIINIALVGNPNCGKTTIFNFASGAREHVGNYSGVTVDAKEGVFKQEGYTFKIVDLPGAYSLSAYSPEELYVRDYINNENPDVVINIVDASNLERNLYLTTQLIDMDVRMVIALNMFDDLKKDGISFDYEGLGKMIGVPFVPTIGKTGFGIHDLFNRVIQVFEERDPILRHVHINYGDMLESNIHVLREALKLNGNYPKNVSKRHMALKLLEKDKDVESKIANTPNANKILKQRDLCVNKIEMLLREDSETVFTNARYGFISGALRETLHQPDENKVVHGLTEAVDEVVTNKYFGFPIFLAWMWLMFYSTFKLGQYPMNWLESGISVLSSFLDQAMPNGMLKDLIVDGIIGGVGGVIVFLPNILILYAFISFFEDSGYMSRASFIMDKLMHKIGLHGKSFIPLVMGFGCNVPAIMSTRTIESRNSRMITMLITPLMSCSARIPIYILIAGTFFPHYAGNIVMLLYVIGVLLAIGVSKLFKRFLFNKEDLPFVMELPPYRVPTTKSILIHMWEKAKQYLQKMGGTILVASIFVWALGYFPRPTEGMTVPQQQENSYIGRVGKTIEPVVRPLGFDWKVSVSLLTGMMAKEVVVSTLGVLYPDVDNTEVALSQRLIDSVNSEGEATFTPLVAFSFLLFVLIYFPCIATVIAVINESHSWKWGLFLVLYTTALAWLVSFLFYTIGGFVAGIWS